MIRNITSGCFITFILPRILILFVLLVVYSASAQELNRFPHKYMEFNIGAQSHFGPYEKQAEISGGYDTLFYDHVKHYRPGFRDTYPVEVVFGFYRPRGFRMEGRIGYFKQDLGLIRLNSQEEFHLAYAPALSFNISTMLYLTNHPERIPFGFFAGFSAGCLLPLKYNLDQIVKKEFGLERIEPLPQLHLSLEGVWNARLTRSGLYFTLKLASDLPSLLIGSTGRFHMQEESSWEVNKRPIKMYSFRISTGFGFILNP